MKYMCRTCQKECDDVPEHLITVHKFSKSIVEDQLKKNPHGFDGAFPKLE